MNIGKSIVLCLAVLSAWSCEQRPSAPSPAEPGKTPAKKFVAPREAPEGTSNDDGAHSTASDPAPGSEAFRLQAPGRVVAIGDEMVSDARPILLALLATTAPAQAAETTWSVGPRADALPHLGFARRGRLPHVGRQRPRERRERVNESSNHHASRVLVIFRKVLTSYRGHL